MCHSCHLYDLYLLCVLQNNWEWFLDSYLNLGVLGTDGELNPPLGALEGKRALSVGCMGSPSTLQHMMLSSASPQLHARTSLE